VQIDVPFMEWAVIGFAATIIAAVQLLWDCEKVTAHRLTVSTRSRNREAFRNGEMTKSASLFL